MTYEIKSDKVFFTSDTHFGHKGMLSFGGRKYPSTVEMDWDIVKKWNEVVPKDGVVFHLGDVSFASQAYTESVLKNLAGKIFLIKGNHDKNMNLAVRSYFVAIHDLFEIKVVLPDLSKQYISLCHYALRTWDKQHYGAWSLHGHSHGSLSPLGKQHDVGVDNNDMKPVSFSEIKAIMDARKISTEDYHRPRE